MDETVRLRRKDTTKGAPLRILCLDGGGVRGYSMLIILQELMHRTFVEIEGRAPQRHEIPKPCDHFDLIAGSGTGGLIALMLGRLRLDLDTCKDLYVRMTRRVFETDKTFAGIPLRSTLFKASKLEEVIREVCREHTVSGAEGNDTFPTDLPPPPSTPKSSGLPYNPARSMSQSSRYSVIGQSPSVSRGPGFPSSQRGDPDALLYDRRENRTKTIVTAVLKGTTQNDFLRSYDSRKEPAPDVNCAVWQAGRATSAAAMAFKPIRIGQSVYLDEGAGKYNPSPEVLDEATVNEWPGREVGVFVSIGTGKRPKNSNANDHEWWEGFLGGTMGDFAEARRRMIRKLEGCETTHEYMRQQHLHMRNVNPENYYRFNVEVGVGEFGMNEWNRLSQISSNTRIYLATPEIETLTQGAAAKMAKSHFAKLHAARAGPGASPLRHSWQSGGEWPTAVTSVPPPSNPMAVELPGDMGPMLSQPLSYHRESAGGHDHHASIADSKYATVLSQDGQPISSPTGMYSPGPGRTLSQNSTYNDSLSPHNHQPHTRASPRASGEYYRPTNPPPPRPPKEVDATSTGVYYEDPQSHMSPTSPTQYGDHHGPDGPRSFTNMGDLGRRLPYPDQKLAYMDGPPPSVNMQSKPQI